MYCSKCGSYLSENETVCPLCGAPLEVEQSQNEIQQNPVQQVETTYTEPTQFRQPSMPVQGQAPQYQQIPPTYSPQVLNDSASPVSIGEWIGSMILRAIPVVGLIMMLVWSFSSSTNPSKKNWARAQIILAIAATVIGVVIGILIVLADSFGGAYYY